MKKLVREHSREYSLFRVFTWYLMFGGYLKKLFGKDLDKMLMLKKKNSKMIDVYYPIDFQSNIYKLIESYSKNRKQTLNLINKFLLLFKELKPYFNNKKNPKNNIELKKIFNIYIEFYALTVFVFVIPEITTLDKYLKEKAYKARKETQEFNESFETILKQYITTNYKDYKKYWALILPEELFTNKLKINEIQNRKNYIFYQGKIYTGSNKKNLQKLEIQLELPKNKVKKFFGRTAMMGCVTGIVRVINSSKQISKVNKGDILVASMTMPKYVPAMHRAAAFVTDEGGITCHAAIIAREMGKPCVIATKIATQVLKDGDIVEVNADKGYVKLLSK